MKTRFTALWIMLALLGAPAAHSSTDLYSWMFNIDGSVTEYADPYSTGGMPVDAALGNGDLGVFTYTETLQGAHNFIGYFDYEFDEPINTFFNERGTASGSVGAGQSWQIDSIDNYEPGNIFDNFHDNALNNSNNVAVEGDVSWALGWDYFLEENQMAVIRLVVGAVIPDAEFFLTHIDNATGERIYFSGDLDIQPIPEPQTMALLGLGCLMLFMSRSISKNFRTS